MFNAAVITVSDKCFRGERVDMSGPAVSEVLKSEGWDVSYTVTVPDDEESIRAELLKCCDDLRINLVLTTGGTGFSPRDVTPEAALSVIERRASGIPEAMRAYSMTITQRACLSREEAGIRGHTLIINLPGSPKAAAENLSAVISVVKHGVEMLLSNGSGECAASCSGVVLSVNISEHRGTRKRPVDSAELLENWGLKSDAHAGPGKRQVSLLAIESVDKIRERVPFKLRAGDFAENILTRGICLHTLPIGTRLIIGDSVLEITQIGKECHNDCEIRRTSGICVMPHEGVFAAVVKHGIIRKGDGVYVESRISQN